MADEITLTISLKFNKGSTTFTEGVNDLGIDVAGSVIMHNRQSVGTLEEAIVLGDVGMGGYILAINRDATNFVEIRAATGVADMVKLLPGEPACFRFPASATAPFAIADTGACELEYWLIEL